MLVSQVMLISNLLLDIDRLIFSCRCGEITNCKNDCVSVALAHNRVGEADALSVDAKTLWAVKWLLVNCLLVAVDGSLVHLDGGVSAVDFSNDAIARDLITLRQHKLVANSELAELLCTLHAITDNSKLPLLLILHPVLPLLFQLRLSSGCT